jgi:kinesin family protein 5
MSEGSKVRVVCRFRPENKIEKSRGGHLAVEVRNDMEIRLQSDKGPMKFTFDRVFAPSEIGGTDWHQKSVFEYAGKPIIEDIFAGCVTASAGRRA